MGSEKAKLTTDQIRQSMTDIMDLVVRVKKINDAAIDFLDQKGLLKEFEAFAVERYKIERN